MQTGCTSEQPERPVKLLPCDAIVLFVDARTLLKTISSPKIITKGSVWNATCASMKARSKDAKADASTYPVVALLSHTVELLAELDAASARDRAFRLDNDPVHRVVEHKDGCLGTETNWVCRLQEWFELKFGIKAIAVDFQASNPPTPEEIK